MSIKNDLLSFLKNIPLLKKLFVHRKNQRLLTQAQHQLSLSSILIEQNFQRIIAIPSDLPRIPVVVSLTSFGKRIESVHVTVLSILCQSVRPELIVLWIAENECDFNELPTALTDLQKHGLLIKSYSDVKSYKKLIPTLEAFPEKAIVTLDDDVIYPQDHIQKLYDTHTQFPQDIICHVARKINRDLNGKVQPYVTWLHCKNDLEGSFDLFPVGVGGVLYPINALHKDVLNKSDFMTLCEHADDLWFKAMANLNGTMTRLVADVTPYENYFHIPNSHNQTLWEKNRMENDTQLAALMGKYSELKF